SDARWARVECWQRGPRRCRARLSSLRAAGSGELRLVGGGGRCAGRVELKHGGEWGSVCVLDSDREARWASVVCRQLGCGRVARASPYAPFGQGTGRIWLQPHFCTGTENSLEECPHFGWGRHFCGHERVAGVTCTDAVELRLAGGGSPCAGRVEVKLQGQWGSVGDDRWDMEDAEVVCQQLGCGSAAGAYSARESFGEGDGPVSLLFVKCGGNEARLWDCWIGGWGPFNVNIHDGDAAVICQGFSRLVGGAGACAGQLEVRQGRAWLGVCEDQVDMKAAQVVCRELGCGEALAVGGSGRFGAAPGSLWDGGFECNGSEPLLSACGRRAAPGQGCSGRASIMCSPYTGFRLGNSSSGCSGRVEVAVRGTWGSVCASEWELPDAHVLCRHLGCGRALAVPPGGSFGSGEGPLRPDTFGCSGSERHPGQCPVAVLGKPPCAPGNAAAVNCSGLLESVRLVEGETRCDGWLELTIGNGTWRPVPGELLFMRNFSNVCREMGCGGLYMSRMVDGSVTLGQINETERAIMAIVLTNIQKKTTALTKGPEWLSKSYLRHHVPPDKLLWMKTAPADIACSGSRQVRLVGSSGRCAGRVEVYSGGSWSSVCQEGWELQDAAVVCRELGCGTALEAPSWARFGAGTGPLWPYMAECSGSEESLWECGRSEQRECGRGLGAGAVCSEQMSVRLAGGRGRCRGYLEVSYNGTWGRVCSDGTSTGTAAAVCRQLGCGHRGWLSANSTQQASRAWLAWVGCEDGARSLWGCPSAPWQLQSCGAGWHAHVDCEEDSDGSSGTDTSPYPEGASSTGVPSSSTLAVGVGTVPVPTVLCVVLGTLLCLALGALAVLLCRARAWRRGGSWWVGAGTDPVWGCRGSCPMEQLSRWVRGDLGGTQSAQGPR
ncbi:PREDICTED: deleted in malignant brain tumors 1 protein-like, partial [Ficedula albicollis]|uniref:deleted in malignant brain tumors 1 protein-like n=1 Tax=Ficedula albicollis TaxID=59894 RepID=UPI0007AD8BBA